MKVKMSVKLIVAAAFVIISIISAAPLSAESVFLKDGTIVEGSIISDSAAYIKIKDKDNRIKSIPRSEILRVRYTKLKMGKVFIQKRDGDDIVAFIVDEDQDSYTFRKDLYKPEEFVLSRNDVLFMTEKNPSGLKAEGNIGTDRVSLVWLPPYDAVKKYNIYIKKNEKDKYELADSTGSKSITLKNLTSNTLYFLQVTSVDRESYESAPSNELKITTGNIHPDEPSGTSIEKIAPDESRITWKESADPDGKVEKYRIYGTVDKKKVMIAEVRKTEFILKNASLYDNIAIAAVDDKGDESGAVKGSIMYGSVKLGFYPGAMIPMGDFSSMAETGYGGMFTITQTNLFVEGFQAGVEAGFYYLPGKDLLFKEQVDYYRHFITPLLLYGGYSFELSDDFSIVPSLSAGYAWVYVSYMDNRMLAEKDETSSFFDPMVKCGLEFEYRITKSFSISLLGEYGALIEKSGSFPFTLLSIGAEYKF